MMDEIMSDSRVLEVRRLGVMSYAEALSLQERLVVERREGRIPDQLLLLEHPHVITLGTGSEAEHVLASPEERERLGIQVFEVGRGGDVTYHGPGQLVGYPILDLKPDRKDVHRYLRDLEEVLIRVLGDLGLEGRRSEGLTGVWVEDRKLASIGVRVSSRWITSHGFALNVCTDLSYFGTIVPCGIPDRAVSSLEAELGHPIGVDAMAERVAEHFGHWFGREGRVAEATVPDL
jgi:lipoyl(octanoyl) transferase